MSGFPLWGLLALWLASARDQRISDTGLGAGHEKAQDSQSGSWGRLAVDLEVDGWKGAFALWSLCLLVARNPRGAFEI